MASLEPSHRPQRRRRRTRRRRLVNRLAEVVATLAALVAVAVLGIVVLVGRAARALASYQLELPDEGPAASSASTAAGSRR